MMVCCYFRWILISYKLNTNVLEDVAAKVSHNVVQDDTATKFITDTVCPAAVDTFMGLVLKDRTLVGSAITSIVDGKGHHRSGPSSSGIVTDGKPLSVITTALITFDPNNPVGSLKGLALEPLKQKLREACAYTWVKGATSCTDGMSTCLLPSSANIYN